MDDANENWKKSCHEILEELAKLKLSNVRDQLPTQRRQEESWKTLVDDLGHLRGAVGGFLSTHPSAIASCLEQSMGWLMEIRNIGTMMGMDPNITMWHDQALGDAYYIRRMAEVAYKAMHPDTHLILYEKPLSTHARLELLEDVYWRRALEKAGDQLQSIKYSYLYGNSLTKVLEIQSWTMLVDDMEHLKINIKAFLHQWPGAAISLSWRTKLWLEAFEEITHSVPKYAQPILTLYRKALGMAHFIYKEAHALAREKGGAPLPSAADSCATCGRCGGVMGHTHSP